MVLAATSTRAASSLRLLGLLVGLAAAGWAGLASAAGSLGPGPGVASAAPGPPVPEAERPSEPRRQQFVWVAGVVLGLLSMGALGLLVRSRRAPAAVGPARAPAALPVGRGAAKICPTCGARYECDRRLCERDDTELATLN
jgi:hypothetical protein